MSKIETLYNSIKGLEKVGLPLAEEKQAVTDELSALQKTFWCHSNIHSTD